MSSTSTSSNTEQLARLARNFGRSDSGAALSEYAMLLAVLVASSITAYVVVAAGADRAFRVAERTLGIESGSRQALSPANTGGLALQPPGNTGSNVFAGLRMTLRIVLAVLGITVWAATAAIGFLLLRTLRRWVRMWRSRLPGGQHALVPLPPGAQERLVEKRQQIRRLLMQDFENSLGFNTQVRHVMSKRLVVVKPGELVRQAAATMRKQRIRHVLVCQERRQLVGIVSDRDLKERTGETVEDIMTSAPIVVPPDMAVGPAISIMISKSISCLPVVDQGMLYGVLTTTDLLLVLQCTLHAVGGITTAEPGTGGPTDGWEPLAADRQMACGEPVCVD